MSGEKKSHSRWKRWFVPTARNLHPWPRLAVGLVQNVTLVLFLIPDIGIISNLVNIYYERINLAWQWTASLGSLVAVMALLPVIIFSRKSIEGWLALVLILLPLGIAFEEWFQWLDFLVSHGLELH
jgi:hypothetical protein